MTSDSHLHTLRVPRSITTLEGLLNGFRAYQVLKAALDLGLFELLAREGGLGREDIASRLGVNGMFIRSFLLSLVDIGLVAEQGGKYRNTETADCFLVKNRPLYQGDWIEEDTGKASRWGDLAAQLQKMTPDAYAFDLAPRTSFIRALGQRSLRGELQGVTREIASWDGFPTARTVLDLGGGHGLYAIALCQINPDLHGVVFDKPHIIPETQRFLDAYNMSDRLCATGGDIDADAIEGEYDIVVASHILYKFRKNMPGFFQKVWETLKPGGLLVLNHWFCAPGCLPRGGLVEMDKAFLSFGHPLCHIETFNGLLADCGFDVVSSKEISSTYGTSNLHIAMKAPAIRQSPQCRASSCCSPR